MARTYSKIVKNIPSSEVGHGVECHTKSGDKFIISQNPIKKQFTLWKCVEDGFEKITASNSPFNLYKIVFEQ